MIYIHSRCVKLIDNFKQYSYQVDKNDDVMRDIVKKHDDGIDALRYAVESIMKNKCIDYTKWKY
jgi:phage terminase large subunit